MASSISKFNSELRKDEAASERSSSKGEDRRESDYIGKKRSREERDLEEAKRERDQLRH